MRRVAGIITICLVLSGINCLAASKARNTDNYDYVVKNLFWHDLYADGGWSLYCGYRFGPDRMTARGRAMVAGHIYPVTGLVKYVHCRSRLQCYDSGNEKFRKMDADLHNLYPVWDALVIYRYERRYGEIKTGNRRFKDCDFEWKGDVVEPRPIARGNIARAYFYMHRRYGLPINPVMLPLLKRWNRDDPPSSQEKYRNNRIQTLQGVRNPYIDNPTLADRITSAAGKEVAGDGPQPGRVARIREK
ncbi:MAG: endonuclease [Gammaproteobacteria bacterium]|jgi:deoxyribonuclease-1